MVKIGAIWEGVSSKGKPYLRITFDFPAKFIIDDSISIVCFENEHKAKNPDAPTWDVLIDKKKPRQSKQADDDEVPFGE